MTFGTKTRCLLLAAGLTAGPMAIAQSERIVWAMVDWPPYTILRDRKPPKSAQDLGAGVADRHMAEIIKRMPGYTHTFQITTTQRMWGGMERGENLCYAVALKTAERVRYALFTPSFIGPPPALVVHRKYRDALVGDASVVSLTKLLKEHGSEGRLQEKRAYGVQLDAVIAAHPDAIKRELVPTTGALLRPLSAGLFGFTLEYPAAVEYARRNGELSMPVDTIGVSEAPDWIAGQIACTRNAWGRQAIADIDAAIRKAAATPAYSGAVGNWLPKEFAQKNAERMRTFYEARSQSGLDIE